MQILVNNIWLALSVWVVLYISDYSLSVLSVWLYNTGANQHQVFERGLELTPLHQKDVNRARKISLRFIIMLILSSSALYLVWITTVGNGVQAEVFEFVFGSWLLLELSVHIRHLRNLFTFYYMKKSRGVDGTIRFSMWFSYRISSVDLAGFSGLYLILYFLTGRSFFLGGALAGLATALFHLILGFRARKKVAQ